jgi:hypothetical protein
MANGQASVPRYGQHMHTTGHPDGVMAGRGGIDAYLLDGDDRWRYIQQGFG